MPWIIKLVYFFRICYKCWLRLQKEIIRRCQLKIKVNVTHLFHSCKSLRNTERKCYHIWHIYLHFDSRAIRSELGSQTEETHLNDFSFSIRKGQRPSLHSNFLQEHIFYHYLLGTEGVDCDHKSTLFRYWIAITNVWCQLFAFCFNLCISVWTDVNCSLAGWWWHQGVSKQRANLFSLWSLIRRYTFFIIHFFI